MVEGDSGKVKWDCGSVSRIPGSRWSMEGHILTYCKLGSSDSSAFSAVETLISATVVPHSDGGQGHDLSIVVKLIFCGVRLPDFTKEVGWLSLFCLQIPLGTAFRERDENILDMKTEDKTFNHSKEEKKLTKQSKITLRRERIDVSNWALSRLRRATAPSPVLFCCCCRAGNHNMQARPWLGIDHINKTAKRTRYSYQEKAIKIHNWAAVCLRVLSVLRHLTGWAAPLCLAALSPLADSYTSWEILCFGCSCFLATSPVFVDPSGRLRGAKSLVLVDTHLISMQRLVCTACHICLNPVRCLLSLSIFTCKTNIYALKKK